MNSPRSSDDRIPHFAVVTVRAGTIEKSHLDGKRGIVLGCPPDDGPGCYAAYMIEHEAVWAFDRSELEDTGERVEPSTIYDGSSVKVVVDRRGRGHVVE